MAKKRSKKDRIRAKMRRVSATVVPVVESKVQTIQVKKESESVDYLREIFSYDPKLILKDLHKTFFVVLFVLLVLLAIFLLYT